MAREKAFENEIKKYLNDNGCWFVKFFANMFTESGVPDLLTCVNGRFLGVEVKADDGEPTPLQLHKRKKIREAGGISVIVYPDQFEDLKLLIGDLLAGRDIEIIREEQYHFDREDLT